VYFGKLPEKSFCRRSEVSDNKVSGLLITGLLAVLGTVTGGVVQGYWDTQLSEKDFQSKLILRALEPDDVKNRVTSLQFLVDARLISSPDIRDGLKAVLEKGEDSLPQFVRVGATTSLGVSKIDSARNQAVEKHPVLQGKNIALVGFAVRHGDIIDALTPIFSEVTPGMELVGEYNGERIGGTGGGVTVLKKPGYVVTGFDIQRGYYFGRSEVVHIQVTWKRLSKTGMDEESVVTSEKLGSGNHARIDEPPKQYRAKENAFISDFVATTSTHTSGETFLNDFEISETVIVSSL
jgi:hypothetical protein